MTAPKILSEKVEFEKGWIRVISTKVKFPNDSITEWLHLDRSGVVCIVAVDEEKNVYLVKEWRSAWKKHVLEIPIGGCSATSETGIIKKAHEELQEEIGFDCKHIIRLCPPVLCMPRIKLKLHIFLATGLFESKRQGDEHEYIEVVKMPLDEAIKLFSKKETTSHTLIGLILAKEKLK